jgi:hypothetical protein
MISAVDRRWPDMVITSARRKRRCSARRIIEESAKPGRAFQLVCHGPRPCRRRKRKNERRTTNLSLNPSIPIPIPSLAVAGVEQPRVRLHVCFEVLYPAWSCQIVRVQLIAWAS